MKNEKITKKIAICPNCQKIVEASEYFSRAGFSDLVVESTGTTIVCSKCDYSGLPLEVSAKDFEKLNKLNASTKINKANKTKKIKEQAKKK